MVEINILGGADLSEVEKVKESLTVEGLPEKAVLTVTLKTPDGRSYRVVEVRKPVYP